MLEGKPKMQSTISQGRPRRVRHAPPVISPLCWRIHRRCAGGGKPRRRGGPLSLGPPSAASPSAAVGEAFLLLGLHAPLLAMAARCASTHRRRRAAIVEEK